MQLIIDSGATKANWLVLEQQQVVEKITTLGISPLHLSEKATADVLHLHLKHYQESTQQVFFYGTGCGSPQQQADMRARLQQFFTRAKKVEVQSDLLAAARALLGRQAGIATILGTGSNSCFYDGQKIIYNWGGNGYVLGDEGSGATLGKRLLNKYLTAQLPKDLQALFVEEFKWSRGEILQKVYQEPLASRYLGSFVPFVAKHRKHFFIQEMLHQHFQEFINTNIKIYPQWEQLPIGISGSVGYYFQEEIMKAAGQIVDIQRIIKEPLAELLVYHQRMYQNF